MQTLHHHKGSRTVQSCGWLVHEQNRWLLQGHQLLGNGYTLLFAATALSEVSVLKVCRQHQFSHHFGHVLIYAQGLDKFYQRCAETGVDAVLVADIPLLAAEDYIRAAKTYGIQPVFICPPNADAKTVQRVAQHSEGYTYLVSRAGVTSAENQNHAANLDNLVELLQANNAAPILQGFGIAQPQQVKDALAMGVAGAISGSATVKIIERNLHDHTKCLTELAEFVRNMKAATLS